MRVTGSRKRLTQQNIDKFSIYCRETVSDKVSSLEYFSRGASYRILGLDSLGITVLNNYSTPHTLGQRNSSFFRTHFKLVENIK